jgi:hypothetical protein
MDAAVTAESPIMKAETEQRERKARYDARSAANEAKVSPAETAPQAETGSTAEAPAATTGTDQASE